MAKLIYNNDGKGNFYSHSFEIKLDSMAELFVTGQGATKKEALENFRIELRNLMEEIKKEIDSVDWDILVDGDDKPTDDYW